MITKVTHGWRPSGLIAYLMGPGTAEEHVRPRVIASWDGLDADWQPEPGPVSGFDLWPLIDALHVPATRAGLPVSGPAPSGRGYVWHCSARLSAHDRTLSDEEWAAIARRLLDGAGVAATADHGGPRWFAVRHADDHVHIAVVLVREDAGRRFWPRHDYRGLRRVARELEAELDLTRTASGDRTAAPRAGRAEVEIAARQGVEPARAELARAARKAAVAARSPDEFADLLRGRGYLVQLRRLPSGDPIGYKIARAADRPIWFSGGKLAPDLSMPKLITCWSQCPAAPSELGMRETLGRADQVVRRARLGSAPENVNGVAHAVGDVFTALAATTRGDLGEAALRYDRAARAPFEPVPPVGPVGAELRALARCLMRARRHGDTPDAASTVALLIALAALVQQIARWRAEQGNRHQAAAARDAARLTAAAADQLRPHARPRSHRAEEVAPSLRKDTLRAHR